MNEKQKELMTEANDLEAMSNVLKTNLQRSFKGGQGVEAQDVARVTELHNKAVRIAKIAEGLG